jgi:hypothetical protein
MSQHALHVPRTQTTGSRLTRVPPSDPARRQMIAKNARNIGN